MTASIAVFVLILAQFVTPIRASGNAFVNGMSYANTDSDTRFFCQQLLPTRNFSNFNDDELGFVLYVAIVTNTDRFLQTAVAPRDFLDDVSSLLKNSKVLEQGLGLNLTVPQPFIKRLHSNPAYANLWLSLGVKKDGTVPLKRGIVKRGFTRQALWGFIKKTTGWLGNMDGLYGFTKIPHSFIKQLGTYIYMNYGNAYHGQSDQNVKRFLDDARRELRRNSCTTPNDVFLKSMLLLVSQM